MITVTNLVKRYDQVEALKGISFTIKEGEFYGLLGPNGAGKTTTISIMSTLLKPDGGTVNIGGFDVRQNPMECKRQIGVVPQEIALYNELTAVENLSFWGSLYGVSKHELNIQMNEILAMFGLSDRMNDKISTYSGGMKRRINIATALMHKPKVLFMDEPTVGIDPQSRNLIFDVLEQLHRDGMTIVYTTHYMEEAERFCDRIGIIDNGLIVAEGSLPELKKSGHLKESIDISFASLSDGKYQTIALLWPDLSKSENTISFYTGNVQEDLSTIILHCHHASLEITQVQIQKINLETIFLNLTGKQLRD